MHSTTPRPCPKTKWKSQCVLRHIWAYQVTEKSMILNCNLEFAMQENAFPRLVQSPSKHRQYFHSRAMWCPSFCQCRRRILIIAGTVAIWSRYAFAFHRTVYWKIIKRFHSAGYILSVGTYSACRHNYVCESCLRKFKEYAIQVFPHFCLFSMWQLLPQR